MTAILDLPLSSAIDYIFHALEKEKEQAAWELWQGLYPFMMIEFLEFKPFHEYKEDLFRPRVRYSEKSLEEIEEEMNKIVSAYEGHAR